MSQPQTRTATVIIPALNEERNIGALLDDIREQIKDGSTGVEKILVFSDGSTDRTDAIVQERAVTEPRIQLVRNENRLGKIFTLDKAFHMTDTDYAILFDADVRLLPAAIPNLLKTAAMQDAHLTGGNPVPYPPSFFNIASQASMFSWHLLQEIKRQKPESIYSAHGRILALTRDLYTSLNIKNLSTPGDDQFMYFMASSFAYAPEAKVWYRLPRKIPDYIKQNIRFRYAQTVRDKLVGPERAQAAFWIPNKLAILAKTIVRHPYRASCWTLLYISGYILYWFKQITKDPSIKLWGDANSTK